MRVKAESCRAEQEIDIDGTDMEGSKIKLTYAGLKNIFR